MPGEVAVVVVAAGRGARAGGDCPSNTASWRGEPVIRSCLVACSPRMPRSALVQPVIHPRRSRGLARRPPGPAGSAPPVFGGATRQVSVRAGLEALAARTAATSCSIHDAARPFASPALISRAIVAGRDAAPPFPACPSTDTFKQVDAAGHVVETVDRNRLARRADPAGVRLRGAAGGAPARAAAGRDDFTDDAALAEWAGMTVSVFRGRERQHQADHGRGFRAWPAAADRGARRRPHRHRLSTCIPSATATTSGWAACAFRMTAALTGHSDADVALHALVDAILGALADGDIGSHFPPGDPQWRGASSDRFLAFAAERVREARRPHRPSRHHHRLRGAADRAAPRRHARAHRRDRRAVDRPRRRQGDDQREARLHRPRRRHRRHGDRHHPAARTGDGMAMADRRDRGCRAAAARACRAAGSRWRPRNPAPAGWSPAR